MKPHHALAPALVGWYLVVPPDSTVPHSVDSAAPLSRWSVITKFDTADSCKQALTGLQNKNHDPANPDAVDKLRRFKKRQPADPERARARVNDAACIAGDDPRLKSK
jgi:hypothetical protein